MYAIRSYYGSALADKVAEHKAHSISFAGASRCSQRAAVTAFSICAACIARNVLVGCGCCFTSTGCALVEAGFTGGGGIWAGGFAIGEGAVGLGVAGLTRVVVVALRRAFTVTPGFSVAVGRVGRALVAIGGRLSLGGVRAARNFPVSRRCCIACAAFV